MTIGVSFECDSAPADVPADMRLLVTPFEYAFLLAVTKFFGLRLFGDKEGCACCGEAELRAPSSYFLFWLASALALGGKDNYLRPFGAFLVTELVRA